MKLYFHKNKTNWNEYTIRLIEHLMRPYLVERPEDADMVLVSVCDVSEIMDIIKARQYEKPIISGGMIAEYPVVNELSDYSWHGEIYGFRDNVAAGIHPADMANCTTRENRRLVVDERIAWNENPIIGVGSKAKYYYISKGCPVKCKYCYMANVREYQVIPESRYWAVAKKAGNGFMPIAAYNPYGTIEHTRIGETLIKKYIATGHGKGSKMLRAGVEFVDPYLSKSLAKGVTIDDLNMAISLAKSTNTKLVLYFIAGLETQEQLEDYFNKIVMDYAIKPAITIVFTYIDPQPFTPFHDFDISQKIVDIDTKALYRVASARNKRVRMLPLAGPEKSTLRTMLGRCISEDDYRFVKSISKIQFNDMVLRAEERNYLIGDCDIKEVCRRPRKSIVPAYWGRNEYTR
jgi:radical SAM superfamily enzyme YgiQ (UPF0313 family)